MVLAKTFLEGPSVIRCCDASCVVAAPRCRGGEWRYRSAKAADSIARGCVSLRHLDLQCVTQVRRDRRSASTTSITIDAIFAVRGAYSIPSWELSGSTGWTRN